MTVEQKTVSIHHLVYSEHYGCKVKVGNIVVEDHELRTHMLRMLFSKLDEVCGDSDRRQVLALARTFLKGKGPLRSYNSWKNAAEEHLQNRHKFSTPVVSELSEIAELIRAREPYGQ